MSEFVGKTLQTTSAVERPQLPELRAATLPVANRGRLSDDFEETLASNDNSAQFTRGSETKQSQLLNGHVISAKSRNISRDFARLTWGEPMIRSQKLYPVELQHNGKVIRGRPNFSPFTSH